MSVQGLGRADPQISGAFREQISIDVNGGGCCSGFYITCFTFGGFVCLQRLLG